MRALFQPGGRCRLAVAVSRAFVCRATDEPIKAAQLELSAPLFQDPEVLKGGDRERGVVPGLAMESPGGRRVLHKLRGGLAQ